MRTLLFLIACSLVFQLSAQPEIYHTPVKQYVGKAPKVHFFADSVAMRAQASLTGKFIQYIPVNTACYVVETMEEEVMINGIISHWCKVKIEDENFTGVKEGWVWGGFLTSTRFRSYEDPEICFLVSFSKSREVNDEYGSQINSSIKIKAVKENEVLHEIEMEYNQPYIEISQDGKRGVDGVHDMFFLRTPCMGGCGCYTGDEIIFWDGKKLTDVFFAGGIADGHYSTGESLIFPSDPDGMNGIIIQTAYGTDDRFTPADDEDIMRTFHKEKYMEWKNSELKPIKSMPPKTEYIYYDMETHERVER